MGTIAEKLSYLTDTKDLFKDRLNSLGANITSSTTFRNYLTWLDTFYEEVSDKTDLSINGVVGRTSQESTRGINVYNVNSHYVLSDGYSINDENWITNTYDNSQETDHYENIWCPPSSLLKTSTDYLLICEIKSVSGSGILYPYTKHSISAIETQHSSYNFSNLSAGQKILIPVTTKSSFSGVSYDLRTLVRYNAGNSGSITFRLSLLTDTSITSDTFVYEPFTNGASPNTDYPQPINNLTGNVPYKVSGKNLFNPTYEIETQYNTNGNIVTNYYTLNNNKISISRSNAQYGRYFLNKLLLDAGTYTLSWIPNISGTDLRQNYSVRNLDSQIDILENTRINITNGTKVSISFTLTSKQYIAFSLQPATNDSNTLSLTQIQLEKNSTATNFEPYIQPQIFTIPLTSKNLFDKNTNNILNGYFEYTNDTIHSSGANRVLYYECKPNTTYAFTQGDTNISNHVFQVATTTTKPDIGVVVENFADKSGISSNKRFTYTTNTNAKYLVIRLRTGDTTNDFLNGVQIEENNEATSYEPYYDIELCKIDTYEDKIYSSNGRFYLYKNINKEILDGSENWYASIVTGNIKTERYAYQSPNSHIENIGYCNNFIVKDAGTSVYDDKELIQLSISQQYRYTGIQIEKTRLSENNNVNAFKSWLANNNVILYKVLSTPTTTEITQDNYPSLYNALKQIQDYLTSYKINKEFILGYSSPEIEY